MAKKQSPRNPKKVKKGQLAKKAEIDKLIRAAAPPALITVKLPARTAIHRPLKRANCSEPEVTPPPCIARPQTIAVRLPPPRPLSPSLNPDSLKFTDLPGEIRNKIYYYAFHHEFYEIRWADKTHTSLTYGLPLHPAYASPRLTRTACRRRRLFDYPRRVRSNEIIEPYQLSPGPAALLLTCKKVCEEASSLFYGINTFTFQNQGTFAAFLKTSGMRNISSIRSLHLTHHTAGNPFRSQFQSWKHVYDNKWEGLCYQAANEMTSLEELSVDLTINDVPIVFDEDEAWMAPLLWFEYSGLKRFSVKLRNYAALDAVLEAETCKLRDMLIGDECQEKRRESFCFKGPQKIIREGPKVINIRMC